jgi:hypothetical protein
MHVIFIQKNESLPHLSFVAFLSERSHLGILLGYLCGRVHGIQ